MALARGFSNVNRRPGRGALRIRYILKNVSGQRFSNRIALGSASNIHLTKQNHSPAFAILHERAVLKAVTTVDDRQEIAARRFLDQNRSNITAITAAPKPSDRNIAPLDGWSVARAQVILKARREDGCFAPPVAPMFRSEARQSRMIGDAAKNLPQTVLRHAKAEPLLENLGTLFEDHHLEAVAHVYYIRSSPACGQSSLSHDQHIESGEIDNRLDGLILDTKALE